MHWAPIKEVPRKGLFLVQAAGKVSLWIGETKKKEKKSPLFFLPIPTTQHPGSTLAAMRAQSSDHGKLSNTKGREALSDQRDYGSENIRQIPVAFFFLCPHTIVNRKCTAKLGNLKINESEKLEKVVHTKKKLD